MSINELQRQNLQIVFFTVLHNGLLHRMLIYKVSQAKNKDGAVHGE